MLSFGFLSIMTQFQRNESWKHFLVGGITYLKFMRIRETINDCTYHTLLVHMPEK